MRNLLLLCIAVFSFGFAHAQDCTGADHTVLAGNLYYNPASLTITAGETIAFQNEGGTHNVNGVSSTLGDTWNNPETFSLGANSGAPGGVCMGTVTLNTPGTYQYDCSIGSHAAGGMVGTIIVEAAAPSTVDVTINVNMANETTSPDGVFLAGGLDFGVAGDNPMSDTDGDDIWTITVQVPVGYTGNYTFLNGNCPDWSCKENIVGQSCADGPYSDRLLSNITENTTINTCFSECTTDGSCTPIGVQPAVTFQVDMSNANLAGGEAILVTGSFDGWCGGCSPALSDTDGDNIYTGVLNLNPNADYEFKYMINGWGGDEQSLLGTDCDFLPGDGFGNRGFSLGESDLVLDVQCFDFCGTCAEQDAAGPTDPVGPTDNAAEPTLAQSEVISVYGSAYTSIATNLNPGWGQSGTVNAEYDPGTGNTVLQYANFNYQGTDLTNADASGMTHLHLDVWVEAGTDRQLKVTPVNAAPGGNQESLVNVPLTPGAWNSVDLAQTDFVGMTWENLIQMKFDGQFNGDGSANPAGWDVYLDNIYFWNDGSGDNGGGGDPGTGGDNGTALVNLTFDDAASVDSWQAVADATLPEASLAWNATGVETGALEVSGTNTVDDAGRAYIFQYVDGNVDYAGSSDVTLSFDIKAGSPLVGAAVHLQTEFPGVGTTNTFDIQNSGINENDWTSLSYDFSGVSGNGIFRIQFNIAAGAFSGAGGTLLIDNISVSGNGSGGGGGSTAGCMDADASNYNDLADTDDGSCTYDITFQVDMSQAGLVDGDIAYVNGSFNGWCGACNPLSDDDADGVWTATIPLAPGVIEYKFTINGWTAQEELGVGAACDYNPADEFANRGVEIVDAPITLDVVCYNSCEACVIGGDINGCTDELAANYNSAATIDDGSCTYPVTFKVDMSDYTGTYGVVNLNGSFNGWCGGCNAMTDTGDNVYEVTINVPADTIEYKFTLDGWTAQEEFAGGEECTSTIDGFTNRSSIITGATVLDVVCYNSCTTCENAGTGGGGGSTDLVATLDVSCSGMTDITEVRLFGPFWNWDPAGGPVATLNADGNYEVVFSPAPDADMEYKWLINGEQEDLLDFGPDLNGDGYDDFLNADCVPITDYFSYANRLWTVGSGDIADTWSQCAPCPAADSVLVTITVDMSEEEVNPIGVFVAGNFQGWSPGSTIATDNGDGTWSYSFNAMPGDNVQYKWLNGTAWGFEESVPADCQYPGDTNRGFDVPSEDYSHPVHCYGSCNPCGAATYAATFTVLTDNITVAADGMHIAGAFEGWSGTAMSDNGDGSWSITLDLEAGSYEFKFQNGLGGWEELDCGGNRSIAIDGSGAVSYTGCFAQCGESTSCATDPDPANITFRVDMSEVTDLVADSVYMIGGFTDPVWQAGAILMDDTDGDLVYEATVLVSGPASIAYKFFNGNPYPNGQGTEVGGETADFAAGGCGVDNGVGGFNRTHDRSGADEVLDIVCFNSCAACGDAPLEGTEVTFSVDMNNYGAAFGFVNVSGTWNEFCGDCNPMTDDDMDGIWTATVTLPEGENYRYKFQVDNWADQEDLAPGDNPIGPCVVKEGGFTNRDLDVAGSEAIVLDTVCWNSCQACIGADDVAGCNDETASNYDAAATANDGSCIYDVTLSVNMNEYALADGDTVYVNSEFNGWCGACNPMSDDDMDGVWTVTLPLTSDYYEYKFTVNGWAADENLAGIGGCVTENFGFTNRVLQLFGNQSEPVVCWNSCSNCEGGGDIAGCTDPNAVNYAAIATVDDGSCQYNVTFQVDMSTTALNGGDIVYVNGGFNGWCGACNPMSDDDMDGVWTVTLPLPGGEHEYKFTINGWDMQEELTVGDICDWNPNDTFANRGFNLTGDLVLDVVCYNSCYSCDVSTGCTDAGAQNYDADADVDDGSCAYMVTLRLDMSQQMVSADGVHVAGSFQGWDPAGTSMTTPGLDLYEYTLQLSNGAHQFIYINGNTWDGQETVPAECGADNGLGGYNREIIVDGADMVLPVVCLNSCTACSGCTDPLSMEFSPFAGEDDGSCATPLVFGCTYQDADNYNPAANMEDGSCEFTGGSSCPTDIDGDGSTAVGDLLIILGSFGQPCE